MFLYCVSVYFVFYKRPRNHSQMCVGSRIRSSRLNQITKLTKRERDRGDPPRVCSLNRGGSLQVPAPLDAEPRVTHPYVISQNVPRNWIKQKRHWTRRTSIHFSREREQKEPSRGRGIDVATHSGPLLGETYVRSRCVQIGQQ